MPPHPFPYPLRVGIDICHVARIKALLVGKNTKTSDNHTRPLVQFLSRVFTWPERQAFDDRFGSHEEAYKNLNAVSTYLAGRWAAKEACRKACPHLAESNGFRNIMILPAQTKDNSKLGPKAPTGILLRQGLQTYLSEKETQTKEQLVRFVGSSKSQFNIDEIEGQFFQVSISHDGGYATAVAIVPPVPKSWSFEVDTIDTQGQAELLNDYELAHSESVLKEYLTPSDRRASADSADLVSDKYSPRNQFAVGFESLRRLERQMGQLNSRIRALEQSISKTNTTS